MCLECRLHYAECSHAITILSPCPGATNYCRRMVKYEFPVENFCPRCYLLPDPRDTELHDRREGQYYAYGVERYNNDETAQAEAERLILQSNSLTGNESVINGEFIFGTNILSNKAEELLECMLHKYILPYFWSHIDDRGEHFEMARSLLLRLQSAYYICLIRSTADIRLDCDEWCAAYGVTARAIFEPLSSNITGDHMNETCPICRDDTPQEENDKLVKTSCGHIFHQSCLETNAQFRHTCPICRSNICGPYPPVPDYNMGGPGVGDTPAWLSQLAQLVDHQPQRSPDLTVSTNRILRTDMDHIMTERNKAFEEYTKAYNDLRRAQSAVVDIEDWIRDAEILEYRSFIYKHTDMFYGPTPGLALLIERPKWTICRVRGDIYNARQRLSQRIEIRRDFQTKYDEALEAFLRANELAEYAKTFLEVQI